MTPSQDPDAAVSLVEDALVRLLDTTSQTERAEAIGLTGHAQISRREQLVHQGSVECFVDTYPLRYGIRLARWNAGLRTAFLEALSDEVPTPNADAVEGDLGTCARDFATELAAILADLAKGKISPKQAQKHDAALQLLQDDIQRARIDLSRRARGGRS